jgi:hypothetical protein
MRTGRKTIIVCIVLLLAVLSNRSCYAQFNSMGGSLIPAHKGHHWRKTAFKPKVLLVQLRSEKSKIDYLTQHKQFREANKVRKEASIVRKVMKNDFEENFSFCPVYYFIDTNSDQVKKQEFDNVLFTADGLPMKNNILYPGDTNYFIVYYGYPEDQMEIDANPDEYDYVGNGEVMGRGLIFLSYKYQQVDFYYRFAYWDIFKKPNPRYSYRSADYDMEYFPFAGDYEKDLQDVYNMEIVSRKLPRY